VNFIAFLRGINVSGQKRILMADLKKLLQSLHFSDIQTYIQSGNILFQSNHDNPAERIRKGLMDRYSWDIPVFCFQPEELGKYLDTFPFESDEPDLKGNKTYLSFFDREPKGDIDLNKFVHPGEKLVYLEKALWIYCPDGYGKSKLSNSFLEKKLNVTATTRNLKTLKTMVQLAEEY